MTYLIEEIASPHLTSDGRILDFPKQTKMASLRATSVSSIWSIDSIMFTRKGVFEDGFRLYVPGHWEYRDKVAGQRFIHQLSFGDSEFVKSSLSESPYVNCKEWRIDPGQTKEILGIPCIKATRLCQDKKQTVYFTRTIPILDGPVFAHSIPGLILEFEDGNFHFLATSVTAIETPVTAPATIKLIPKDQVNSANSQLRLSNENVTPNVWINLENHYRIR